MIPSSARNCRRSKPFSISIFHSFIHITMPYKRKHIKMKKTRNTGILLQTLRDQINSFNSKHSTTEEIIKYLRSNFHEYSRIKDQVLRIALRSIMNDDDDRTDSSVKRHKKNIDQVEEQEEETTIHNKSSVSCDSVLASDSKFNNGGENVNVNVRKEGPRFKDLGGMEEVIKELKYSILMPFFNPKMCKVLGVKPINGLLLHGLPGCGKTKLAHAIAYETGFHFFPTSATELVSGISGASEESIRELFAQAKRTAPSIIFIDEIDAIAPKRDNTQRLMETRIVTQLMVCMEINRNSLTYSEASDEPHRHVLVIGATNKPDDIESAMRRPGRFDREITIGIPDESGREKILTVVTRKQKLDSSVDLQKLAMSASGFVGADLEALANEAGIVAMNRISNEMKLKLSQDLTNEPDEDSWKKPLLPDDDIEKCAITMSDFEEAIKKVQPSLTREGFTAIPNVKWEDVGALDHVREVFDHYLLNRIKHPDDYKDFVMNLGTGFLLYGPPGCGKTLIAKAVANQAGANFIYVKGPELLNKYVGASEQAVRTIFSRARACAPCIIFFDEVDALTPKRDDESGHPVANGVVNQFLAEMNGGEESKGVFVIGATNRPTAIDIGILRSGRFGKRLEVPLPSPDDRVTILKTLAKGRPIDDSVDLSVIGRMKECENFSGADLAELMTEAGMAALIEKWNSIDENIETIKTCHFEVAFSKVSPSLSEKEREYYKNISKFFEAVSK